MKNNIALLLVLLGLFSAHPVAAVITYGGVYLDSTNINTPGQLWLSNSGTMYVTNSGTTTNSKVNKFDSNQQLITTATLDTPSVAKPQGITYSPATGLLYVAARNTGIVYSFDTDLASQTSAISGLSAPIGLAVNQDGSIVIIRYSILLPGLLLKFLIQYQSQ